MKHVVEFLAYAHLGPQKEYDLWMTTLRTKPSSQKSKCLVHLRSLLAKTLTVLPKSSQLKRAVPVQPAPLVRLVAEIPSVNIFVFEERIP